MLAVLMAVALPLDPSASSSFAQTATPPSGSRSASPPVQAALDRAAILGDSEIRFTEAGGIAGYLTTVEMRGRQGEATVDYRPPRSRVSTPPHSGTLTAAEYLALWKQLDEAQVWTLAAKQRGAASDQIQSELRVRVGARTHTVIWLEGDASDGAKTAARLADAIRQTADRAALLR